MKMKFNENKFVEQSAGSSVGFLYASGLKSKEERKKIIM